MSDYRQLSVWQKAKALAVAIYRAVSSSAVAKDFGLRDQMLRAAVSAKLLEGALAAQLRDSSEEVSRMLYSLRERIRE